MASETIRSGLDVSFFSGVWRRPGVPLASDLLLVFSVAALLHLFLAFPAPRALLAWLRALGPTWLRRLGGATMPVLYLLPLALVLSGRVGLWPAPEHRRRGAHGGRRGGRARAELLRRPATPQTRAQLKWVLWGLSIPVGFLVLQEVLSLAAGRDLRCHGSSARPRSRSCRSGSGSRSCATGSTTSTSSSTGRWSTAR